MVDDHATCRRFLTARLRYALGLPGAALYHLITMKQALFTTLAKLLDSLAQWLDSLANRLYWLGRPPEE